MSTAIRTQALALEIQHLSKVYKKRKGQIIKSVDNLNLSVSSGQVFGLLGPNGAGKTTTIKMICGLIIPSAGQVLVNGRTVTQKRSEVMREIGAVLEGTRNIYWRLSAWQNLVYFGRLKACSAQEIRMRAEPLLRELDLWKWKDEPVGQFSRGMQQKVAIACVLIADPSIVLLDEPTLGLDVQAARTVKEWVIRLAHEKSKTVIITSHELDMVQEVCDHVAILRQGRLVADKPMDELLALFRQEHYEIRIGKHIDDSTMNSFAGLTITTEEDGTLLSGPVPDQDKLHQILIKIHSLGLPLTSINQIEPDLEEVFLHLISESAKGNEA
jgi:ABC-2 type transport system ATP-binding protein